MEISETSKSHIFWWRKVKRLIRTSLKISLCCKFEKSINSIRRKTINSSVNIKWTK
jgi:hypothetical protein